MFAKWEWIIIELLVLGLLVFELVRTRRDIRRAKQAERQAAPREQPPVSPP